MQTLAKMVHNNPNKQILSPAKITGCDAKKLPPTACAVVALNLVVIPKMESATDMDDQTKREFRFFKIFGITFPLLCVLGGGVVLSMNWIEDLALKPFLEALQHKDANAVLCDSQNLDLQKVREIFDKKTRTKIKGSHPTSRIKLLVESQGISSEIEINQDSRNNSLFWLYSEANKINGCI